MNDQVQDKHPSALSDAERQASLALLDDDGDDEVPAAEGTEATPKVPVADDGDDDGLDDGKPAPKPDAEIDPDTLKAIAADGEPAGHSPMIPKARFDEVNSQLKDLRGKVESLESARAAAAATVGEPRDFSTEKAALDTKYEDGDITLAEYLAERDKLVIEEVKYATRVEQAQAQAEAQTKAAQDAWNTKIGAWMTSNAEFLSNAVRRDAWERLLDRYGTDANLTDEQLIEKVQAEAFEAFSFSKSAPKPGDNAPPNKHAARNAADAAAQSAASAVPSPAAGGMGERGRGASGVDILALKPGEFGKLTKEQQKAALGEDE